MAYETKVITEEAAELEVKSEMIFTEKVKKAKELIKAAIQKDPNIAVGCSFGKDSMVLLHLCLQVKPDLEVFSIMASTELPETFEFAERMAHEWKLNYKEYSFDQEPRALKDRSLCCKEPKVAATREALQHVNAWISGIRNTEGVTRANFKYIEKKGGLLKYNPILEFTEMDIWRYLAVFNVPLNPAYRMGFRSLGCKFCSTPEERVGEAERDGRWKGTPHQGTECGLHTQILKK